mgnify:CR=1 FL=1
MILCIELEAIRQILHYYPSKVLDICKENFAAKLITSVLKTFGNNLLKLWENA